MNPEGIPEAIASQFPIGPVREVRPFEAEGNINRTWLVLADGEFLLQRLNSTVFPMPERVMQGMRAALQAQDPAPDRWTTPELIPSMGGRWWIEAENAAWRMVRRIDRVVSYKALQDSPAEQQLDLAFEAGRGLGIFTRLVRKLDASSLQPSLPGYRDTGLYYRQLRAACSGLKAFDEGSLPPELRAATGHLFRVHLPRDEWERRMHEPPVREAIGVAFAEESLAMTLWDALADGSLQQDVIHGDPKLENFLFDLETMRVRALVDLDTIMPFTWLADWGDLVRSLANPAGETERDLGRVAMDRQVVERLREGFLQEAGALTADAVALMDAAARALTLEQAVRFLADYLRGDVYYALNPDHPPDLNLRRALVQFRLFETMQS
ncbi:MAG TPA: phosphotransferase [Fimbriimonadaceae bacterium]|nr:phosphotransferase [Fimbriimonadaceae bacterium]